jgi:hypothetical protein
VLALERQRQPGARRKLIDRSANRGAPLIGFKCFIGGPPRLGNARDVGQRAGRRA